MKYIPTFALVLVVTWCAANDQPYLASIPISVEDTLPANFATSTQLQIEFVSAHNAAKQTLMRHSEVTSLDKGRYQITLAKDAMIGGNVLDRHLNSSFVIDLEERATADFVNTYTAAANDGLKTSIERFVSDYIVDPTFIHGFNIASKVAADKSGDCTEYAVLTTAILRHLGVPTKIVLGAVIISDGNKAEAFGHAWTEAYIEGQWHIVDAALYKAPTIAKFYLPVDELTNETAGYGLFLMASLQKLPAGLFNISDATQK